MMKDIKLPINTDTSIDLSSINAGTEGLILVYKNDKCVGYINYDTNYWYYNISIDAQECTINYDTLYNLIMELLNKELADSFKLIEFEYD